MTMSGLMMIDGRDAFSAFGLVRVNKSDDALKLPTRKKAIEIDYTDADGTYTDTASNFYDGRVINIDCVLLAADQADYWQKFQAMEMALTMPGLREIYIKQFGASFRGYYVQGVSLNRLNNFTSGQVGVQLTIQFKEVTPLVLRGTVAADLTLPVALAKVTKLNMATGTLNLDGTASYCKLGFIANYSWTQVSGPACTIVNTLAGVTAVAGLTQGQQYVFALGIVAGNGKSASVQQSVYFPVSISGPKVTKFNFGTHKLLGDLSADAAGWTGVHGNPDVDTISVTSAVTGVSVVTNPGIWRQDAATTYAAGNGVVTGANSGFAPDAVLANYWMSQNVNGSVLYFSGFTPGATVYIDLIFGLNALAESAVGNQENVRYNSWCSTEFGLDPLANTNNYLTMVGLAGADGTKALGMFGYGPRAHGITACIITEI